jgi:hypothetical protein
MGDSKTDSDANPYQDALKKRNSSFLESFKSQDQIETR